MSTKHIKTLIVGGGVSGLCAALALGPETAILEKEDEPGGYCRSIRQDGFLWDYAGHFFHFQTEPGRRFFLSMFPPEELAERKKNCQILYHGHRIDYPFQSHIHQLEKSELIDCLYDLFHRRPKERCGSFLELLEGSYGHAVTEKFLRPYNEKLYACPLDALDPAAMGRFFPAVELSEIIDSMKGREASSYNSRFFYPKGGAGALIEALCRKLEPGVLLTGRQLVSVDTERKLACDDRGAFYHYDVLINTAPLNRFLPLLDRGAMSSYANSLSWNKVLVLNLGFERKASDPAIHWLYVPGSEADYYRVGFYDNILGTDRASLYAEIGFASDAVVRPEAELESTLRALHAQGLIREDNRLLSHTALLMDPAYVHLRPDTGETLRVVKERLAEADIACIGRYGGWRYCSTEDCMLEAFALAGRLKERCQA